MRKRLLLLALAIFGAYCSVYVVAGMAAMQDIADASRPAIPSNKLQCLTMVSPHYPQSPEEQPVAATVTLRVMVSKTGSVLPVRMVMGEHAFEAEAMNAVRLWRYRPYVRDGGPIDVITEVKVDFVPGRPAGIVTHPTP